MLKLAIIGEGTNQMKPKFIPLQSVAEMNAGLTPRERISFLYFDTEAEQARTDTMEDYTIKAHERQVEFHRREVEEGPRRQPPMPEVQIDIHRRQLAIHIAALATAEIIPFPVPEPPEDLAA